MVSPDAYIVFNHVTDKAFEVNHDCGFTRLDALGTGKLATVILVNAKRPTPFAFTSLLSLALRVQGIRRGNAHQKHWLTVAQR